MIPLPKSILEWMMQVKYSYNFITKKCYEIGSKRMYLEPKFLF